MNIVTTKSIVLHRTNYGEADKIATLLTEGGDKVSVIAKGVRKPKSKLVAGVELFTVAEITFAEGRGSGLHTLRGAKIVRQHNNFLADYDKVQVAYSIVKYIFKNTDNTNCQEYYKVMLDVFDLLEQSEATAAIELWTWMKILQIAGHDLRLQGQTNNQAFIEDVRYHFDAENGGFIQNNGGVYEAGHIKLLKICQVQPVGVVCRVKNCAILSQQLNPTIKQFVEYNT